MVTSTFYHKTVLLDEAVDGLNIKPNGVYVDATFGGGGHSKEILQRLGAAGSLLAFDQDEAAWTNKPNDPRLIAIHENFKHLKSFLRLHGHAQVDGVLADLGVSSHHFDTASRGFSTRLDGPMDMRMDQRATRTAEEVLHQSSEEELVKIFSEYGEIRNSKELANHLVTLRKNNRITSTKAFMQLVNPVVKGMPHKYFPQVFQALRIAVNEELQVLEDLLRQAKDCVKTGGRLCIITFHSLEDRLAKTMMKEAALEADVLRGNVKNRFWKLITSKPILPSAEELKNNPRARSAKLRIAERL